MFKKQIAGGVLVPICSRHGTLFRNKTLSCNYSSRNIQFPELLVHWRSTSIIVGTLEHILGTGHTVEFEGTSQWRDDTWRKKYNGISFWEGCHNCEIHADVIGAGVRGSKNFDSVTLPPYLCHFQGSFLKQYCDNYRGNRFTLSTCNTLRAAACAHFGCACLCSACRRG